MKSLNKRFFTSLALGTFLIMNAREGSALDVNAGPIWNQKDAENKCPVVCQQQNLTWNKSWLTTVPGQMSVCGCDEQPNAPEPTASDQHVEENNVAHLDTELRKRQMNPI